MTAPGAPSSTGAAVVEGGAAVDLPRLRAWITANGGEVLTEQCTDRAVHYRSIEGLGSVVATAAGYEFTGDGRLALSISRSGGTLNPFALYAVTPVVPVLPAVPFRPTVARATIISDASLCQQSGAAGWAAWMIADGRPSATRGGPINFRCASSTEAELFAIAEALRMAVHDGYAPDGAEVLIQSDSANALAVVRKAVPAAVDRQHATHGIAIVPARKTGHSAVLERTANAIGRLVRKHELTVHVRHVPGHTAGDGRQWVNRQCDRLAKAHMRTARAAQARPRGTDPSPTSHDGATDA